MIAECFLSHPDTGVAFLFGDFRVVQKGRMEHGEKCFVGESVYCIVLLLFFKMSAMSVFAPCGAKKWNLNFTHL